ncbi:hypothetical protein ACI65C_003571 [Semiaphis heraclei]
MNSASGRYTASSSCGCDLCIVTMIHHVVFIIIVNGSVKSLFILSEISCIYSGSFHSGNQICHKDVVKLKYLPKHCHSFVFDGVICDENYNIVPNEFHENLGGYYLRNLVVYSFFRCNLKNLKPLIQFEDKSHPVFLFYSHGTLGDWANAFFLGDFKQEAQKVKDFIGEYNVKGLILKGIETSELNPNENFYEYFSAYISAIKSLNPDLTIGLYLSAANLAISVNEGNESIFWFDFPKINGIVDFYLIEFITFNECCIDLLRLGITPYTSTIPSIMTLEKFGVAFKKSNIDKQKVFFEFLISPISIPDEMIHFEYCQLSYNEYCENKEDNHAKWCIDNNDILYQKGKFAKQFSKGFVARAIDLVDRDNKCKCGNKYITFTMLLKGYNGDEQLTCKAFDG